MVVEPGWAFLDAWPGWMVLGSLKGFLGDTSRKK